MAYKKYSIQGFIEPNPARAYKDVNIAFTRHPITDDVTTKSNEEAIKQSLKNLILLNGGEKPFHSNIGGGIYDMLFENMEMVGTNEIMQNEILAIVTQYEPRIDLTKVDVNFINDQNAVSITLYYVIVNTLEPSSVEIFLKTVR